MKILALEKELPGADPHFFQQYAKGEAWQVWRLQQSGLVREAYFRADRNAAVLILECPSPEEALQILATLPFVKAGLIEFEVIPLKAYPGFARLWERTSPP